MLQLPKIIILILTAFSFINAPAQDCSISIELKPKDSIFKLPASPKDWFEVAFDCTITNLSTQAISIVNPQAYKIFPHPWVISVNDIAARFWPGSLTCAPPFTKEDIIVLQPGASVNKAFTWHLYVQNFARDPGIYKAKVRYNYTADGTYTMGVSNKPITALLSDWSNEVTFCIVK